MELRDLFYQNKFVQRKELKRGDKVYKVSDLPQGLYFVEKGLIGLVVAGEGGHDHLVRLFKKDQIFGHRSLFAKEPYHASATALEGTSILFINKSDIKELMRSNCDFAEKLLELMAIELRLAEQKLISLTEKDVTSRIAETIIYLKEVFPTHNWTRQEIADFCGSTAATVIRTMAKFEDEGLITQNGREFQIVDKDSLLGI